MSLIESPPPVPLAGAALPRNRTDLWSDQRTSELIRLWEVERLSASQIAATLGGGLTRNAVIAKTHRLKLAPRHKQGQYPRLAQHRTQKPKVQHVAQFLRKRKAEVRQAPAVEVAPEVDPVIFSATPCSLEDLTDDTCRWPIGDPGTPAFAFCGGMARGGKPYCGGHMRIAYTPHAPARPRAERTETGWG